MGQVTIFKRYSQKIRSAIRKIATLNNSPPQIATGVAIGVFIGLGPTWFCRTVICLLVASLIRRVNKISILGGSIMVTLPPLIPFICLLEFNIGSFILAKTYEVGEMDFFKTLFHEFSLAKLKMVFLPLLLGSVLFAGVVAIITYFLVLFLVRYKRKISP